MIVQNASVRLVAEIFSNNEISIIEEDTSKSVCSQIIESNFPLKKFNTNIAASSDHSHKKSV